MVKRNLAVSSPTCWAGNQIEEAVSTAWQIPGCWCRYRDSCSDFEFALFIGIARDNRLER